jgi:hypothetical protein
MRFAPQIVSEQIAGGAAWECPVPQIVQAATVRQNALARIVGSSAMASTVQKIAPESPVPLAVAATSVRWDALALTVELVVQGIIVEPIALVQLAPKAAQERDVAVGALEQTVPKAAQERNVEVVV